MEKREYIKISEPSSPLPTDIDYLRNLNNSDWKNWVFYHLLRFYKNYNKKQLQEIIAIEREKPQSRIEDEIAVFIRNYLKKDMLFGVQGFLAKGGVLNDEKVKGIYDISIFHSFWECDFEKVCFNFECKNLDRKQDLVNKYVYYNKGNNVFDGGVYRYFNEKYSLSENFGGMLGFLLEDSIEVVKKKIMTKLEDKFDTSPNGDLKRIVDNSIQANDFTFDSIHNRFSSDFALHHILFDFTLAS
nr:hypothetical protein [uncultured Psychroserpens sp.]